MGEYFGTDGIRGLYDGELVNPGFAYRMGSALGRYLSKQKPDRIVNIAIGRDTRSSGQPLADALTQGFNQHGVYVHDLGIVPTPAVAQTVVEQNLDLGIAVTASHNPASDNGLKLFDEEGLKLSRRREAEIEAWIEAEPPAPDERPSARAFPSDGGAFYINYIRSLMDQNCLSDWRIVLDLANGATFETSPAVFRRWGAEIYLMGNEPDGENINKGCGSEHPEALGRAVLRNRAHLGIAHDGDGDRLVVCDESGEVVDGDIILGLFGLYALRSKALRERTLVTTVQSNLGLDHALREAGGHVERTDVGDRNVARRMREIGANVGGESSGHIILADFATTGDGVLAAVKLIDLICKTGRPLSRLRTEITLFPHESRALRVREKKPIAEMEEISRQIAKAEGDLGEKGRVLVRYSGTEPKLRLLVEAKNPRKVRKWIRRLERAVRSDLEVIDV